MFDWLKSKPKVNSTQTHTDISDDMLVRLIKEIIEGNNDTFCALFLIGFERWRPLYSVFISVAQRTKEWPATMDGMIEFCRSSRNMRFGTELEYEVAQRRSVYLELATWLKILHARAKNQDRPELWDAVAEIWVSLLPGARALRRTLDSTMLWEADSADWFIGVKDEDSGENFCRAFQVPEEIRYHPRFSEWDDRDLSEEDRVMMRKEFDKMWNG